MKINEENNKNSKKKVFKNFEIFPGKIRLIGKDGKQTVLDRDEAIELAKKTNDDLVQVSYDKNSFPKAICKLMNYGKMVYEQKKKEKAAAKKAREANAEAKEVYFSIRIDDGDKNTKINHIRDFITEDKVHVRICVKLLRREMNLLGMAKELMAGILESIKDISDIDVNPSFSSGVMSCVVKPKKKN